MIKAITCLGYMLVIIVCASCHRGPSDGAQSNEIHGVVRASTPPVGWMAQAIAGGSIPIEILCPDGVPANNWRPSPPEIEQFQKARLTAVNGAGFERWLQSAPLAQSRVVRSADAIDGTLIRVRGGTHSHGPQGHHAHEVIDGHTWIDPLNAIAQAREIEQSMASAFPEHSAAFAPNLRLVEETLQSAHARLEGLKTDQVRIFASSTPYGYLARRYGWTTLEREDRGDAVQSLLSIASPDLMSGASRAVVLCESIPTDSKVVQRLELLKITPVVWETGAAPGDRSYDAVLGENIGRLEAALALP